MATLAGGKQNPRGSHMVPLCGFIGVSSILLTNALRHRPLMFQPWLHLIVGGIGALAGSRLASLYDDTTDTMNKQNLAYASLPSWAYNQLSAEELDTELRDKRLAELRMKFNKLAAIEEAEYKAAKKLQ